MPRNHLHSELPPLEERIRLGGGRHDVEVGYAIGEGLTALSRAVATMFTPSSRRPRSARAKRPVAHRLATRR